jgi:hypothetical protein
LPAATRPRRSGRAFVFAAKRALPSWAGVGTSSNSTGSAKLRIRQAERHYALATMLILGIAIVLVAILAGTFIHPLLFLLGLSVIIVALVAD